MKIPCIQKRPDTAFTMLASNLNRLQSLIIEEHFEMCNNHTFIPWSERNTDISFWDDDTKRIMAFEFEAYAYSYGTKGYENNGICLVIDIILTFVKNSPHRTIKDCNDN